MNTAVWLSFQTIDYIAASESLDPFSSDIPPLPLLYHPFLLFYSRVVLYIYICLCVKRCRNEDRKQSSIISGRIENDSPHANGPALQIIDIRSRYTYSDMNTNETMVASSLEKFHDLYIGYVFALDLRNLSFFVEGV